MKKLTLLTGTLALLFVFAASASVARADVRDRLFDFTDEYYLQNGVDFSKIVNRVNGSAPRSTFDSPFFPFQ